MKRGAVLALAAALALCSCSRLGEEKGKEAPVAAPSAVSRTDSGETVVRLDQETQERVGLKTAALEAASLAPEVTAYGRLLEDPARVFVVRAPIAGTLRPPKKGVWPALGEKIADASAVAEIEPRFAPLDRLNLGDRLAAARAEFTSATAAASAGRAAFHRAGVLNADDKNVSDRALEEAEARLRSDESRVAAANQIVEAIETALNRSGGSVTLAAERGGEVVEVLAQPGESVESGQPVLRLASFDSLLARVDAPVGQTVPAGTSSARIVAVGYEGRPVQGRRVSLGTAVDPNTQGQPFVFRIVPSGLPLRPGQSVTAYLETSGNPRKGVLVPGDALIRAEGRTWVYVQSGQDRFIRREVRADQISAGGWFTASGFAAGERVVVTGAQVVFSEERKSQFRVGEEGTGN